MINNYKHENKISVKISLLMRWMGLWTLRKKMPTEKGFLWLNWAQIYRNSSAAIATQRPLTQTALEGEACTEPPASAVNCRPALSSLHLSESL